MLSLPFSVVALDIIIYLPPLEGEVPNEREAEGFVRKLSKKTPQSARSGCQLPFQGSQGGFAARVARLATPTGRIRSSGCFLKSGVAGG